MKNSPKQKSKTADFPVQFVRLPVAMSYMQLSATDYRVLAELFRFYPTPFQSRETLAETTGLSIRTVERSLAHLKDLEVLSWEKGHTGKSNRYTINMGAFKFPTDSKLAKLICDVADLRSRIWEIEDHATYKAMEKDPLHGSEPFALSFAKDDTFHYEYKETRELEKGFSIKRGYAVESSIPLVYPDRSFMNEEWWDAYYWYGLHDKIYRLLPKPAHSLGHEPDTSSESQLFLWIKALNTNDAIWAFYSLSKIKAELVAKLLILSSKATVDLAMKTYMEFAKSGGKDFVAFANDRHTKELAEFDEAQCEREGHEYRELIMGSDAYRAHYSRLKAEAEERIALRKAELINAI